MKTSKELSEMIGVAIGRLALCAGEIPDGEKRQKCRKLAESSIKILGDELHSLHGVASATMAQNQQLASQRDQVQRELEVTNGKLLSESAHSAALDNLCTARAHKIGRLAEALIAAEKDLADLRWLVRGAREGATRQAAPMLVLSTTGPARVPPPPHVGGPNTTAQTEGGVK